VPNIKFEDAAGAVGVLPTEEGSPISWAKSRLQNRSEKVAKIKQNWCNFTSGLKPIIQKMKFIAVALFAGGVIGTIFSSIKYRQYPEWEHWAEKLTYLLVTIASSVVSIVGTVVLIFSIQPE
jgi:phage-related protein